MDAYTWGLVARLLQSWPDLQEGRWPVPQDTGVQPGYRGQRAFPVAGFEAALEASADLWLAVGRLERRGQGLLARAVVRRYLGRRRVPYRWNELVEAVYWAVNW